MKKIKTAIAVLSVISVLFGTFAGCGKENGEQQEPNSESSITESASENTAEVITEKKTEVIKTEAAATSAAFEAQTTEKSKKTETNTDIFDIYKNCLSVNLDHNEVTDEYSCPDYSLYDMDKDGTYELLLYDVRLGSHMDRNVTVYKIDTAKKSAAKIGTISVFQSGATVTEAPDKNGIIVRNYYNNSFINVTKYTYDGKNFSSQTLMDEKSETVSEKQLNQSEKYLGKELSCIIDEDMNNYNVLKSIIVGGKADLIYSTGK